jgi:hypothetical protein
MTKYVFSHIGFNFYKGLKGKLPPVKFTGYDDKQIELVTLAYPKDFARHIKLFKSAYDIYANAESKFVKSVKSVKIADIRNEILEIYPSSNDLNVCPNGFIALFVDITQFDQIQNEFNENDEVANIDFIHVMSTGIDCNGAKIKPCGVFEIFIKKFNQAEFFSKYTNTYIVLGQVKNINIISGIAKPCGKYNIFGGKRNYDETIVESTLREIIEELGLRSDSPLLEICQQKLSTTTDIIKGKSFEIFCIDMR